MTEQFTVRLDDATAEEIRMLARLHKCSVASEIIAACVTHTGRMLSDPTTKQDLLNELERMRKLIEEPEPF